MMTIEFNINKKTNKYCLDFIVDKIIVCCIESIENNNLVELGNKMLKNAIKEYNKAKKSKNKHYINITK